MNCPRIVPMDFSAKLNRACELRRLTNQRKLSEMARVTKSSLNRWLQGVSVPDIREAGRLAAVLEVSLDWLVSDDDEMDPPDGSSISEDEQAILALIADLGLSRREVVKRLARPLAQESIESQIRDSVLGATEGATRASISPEVFRQVLEALSGMPQAAKPEPPPYDDAIPEGGYIAPPVGPVRDRTDLEDGRRKEASRPKPREKPLDDSDEKKSVRHVPGKKESGA